ncbi:hypothetical protein WJ66_00136 [Stenotrophomonas maltophilia WJ66]|nr:hypothetical protein WJ66_00136 [Stenotrophomonas maltophilia WJ66]
MLLFFFFRVVRGAPAARKQAGAPYIVPSS